MNIGFIGYGNLGKALGSSLNLKKNEKIYIKTKTKKPRIKNVYPLNSLKELLEKSDLIFLAVKPNMFKPILIEIKELSKEIPLKNKIFISLAASVLIESIQKELGKETKIVRLMPNLNVKIKMGVTSITKNKNIKKSEFDTVTNLLKNTGVLIPVKEEQIDKVIALAGSAPAYLALYVKALLNLGDELKLSKKASKELVLNTITGSANYFSKEDDLDLFVDQVCSKGGTTIEAVKHLKKNNFESILKSSAKKSYLRSKELTKELTKELNK